MADYEGLAGVDLTKAGSGVIMVPENIPHYYEAGTGILKVGAVGYASDGSTPSTDPAPENRAENYHRVGKYDGPVTPTVTPAQFDWFGRVTNPGKGEDGGQYVLGDFKGHPTGVAAADELKKAAKLLALILAARDYAKE